MMQARVKTVPQKQYPIMDNRTVFHAPEPVMISR